MKKRIWTICLAGFFIAMVIATFVVENIYYDSLPTVEKGIPVTANLTAAYPVPAYIVYGRQEHIVNAVSDFTELTLLMPNGAYVKEETPIYSVPKNFVLLKVRKLEMMVLELQEQNKELALNSDEKSRILYEINELTIIDCEWQIEILQNLYDNEGYVYAGYEGYVHYSVLPNAPVSMAQEIAVIAVDTGERFITWQMPPIEGELIGLGGTVEARLTVREYFDLDGTDVPAVMPKSQGLTIIKAEFNQQSGMYNFTAKIPDRIDLVMDDGANVEAICNYRSQEQFNLVIPTNAIDFDSDYNGTIYLLRKRERIYGEEYYVEEIAVEAIRTLNNQTALRNASFSTEIIFSSDKPLADKMAVKIVEKVKEVED